MSFVYFDFIPIFLRSLYKIISIGMKLSSGSRRGHVVSICRFNFQLLRRRFVFSIFHLNSSWQLLKSNNINNNNTFPNCWIFLYILIFCFSSYSYVMVIIAHRNQIWCWRIQKFVYKELILMRFLLQYSLYNLIKNSTNLEASICVLFHKSSRQVLYMRRMFISDLISQLRERIKWKWKTFMYFETHMLINLCYCRCMWANQRR